jgi:hypothetical protein
MKMFTKNKSRETTFFITNMREREIEREGKESRTKRKKFFKLMSLVSMR